MPPIQQPWDNDYRKEIERQADAWWHAASDDLPGSPALVAPAMPRRGA